MSILINIGGSSFNPKDSFTIDRNKLEERDSGQVTVFNTREQRYEPYDLVTIEVGTEQDFTFSSLGQANLITEPFTSSNLETAPGVTPLFVFDSIHNPIPSGIEEIYLQFEWNQNFLYKKQASFGSGANIFSGIIFFEKQGQDFVGKGGVNFIDIFENEVYGNATVQIPEDADHFTIRMVSVSTNPQGLQFQQLFLNSNETTFAVSIEDVTVTSFEQMLVQADTVLKNRDGLYEHQITLIEAVAKFDGFYPADRIISSSPPKTMSEVLDIYRRELQIYHNLEINWDRRQAWTNRPVRQKEFIGVNFSVILQDLFRGIDAIPRAVFDDGVWLIYPDFYNDRINLITPNPVSQVLQQDSVDYGTRIKSQIKNGIYESARERFFPSATGGVFPKAEGPQKIESKLQYQLDSGIIQITEAIVQDVIIIEKSGTPKATSGIIDIDISEHILTKPYWDGRPTPANQQAEGIHKKNSLFYEIGRRAVQNLFNPGTELLFFNFSDSVNVLANAILESAYEQNIGVTTDSVNFIPIQNRNPRTSFEVLTLPALDEEFIPEKVKIRFKYIPQRNIDITHHRQFLKNMNESTQIHRQRDSQTDVERYKNTLKNLSNRMGNDVLQYIEVFENATPYQLGDYDEQGNVVVRVKNTFFNDYTLTEYLMAEGFGNIDTDASLWQEPSPFEVLSKDITTNIIIEEFIEVSELDKQVTTRLTNDAQQAILATLDSNIASTAPVQAAVMRPILGQETAISTNGLYLPIFTGGGGNTSSYHFRIDDQISAGRVFSDDAQDPRFAQELVYTYEGDDFLGDEGELRDFRFYLVPDVGIDDDGLYPLINAAQIQDFENAALTQTNIIDTIDKDKNAKFAVTFQQHIVTDDPHIIIGPAFAKFNRLLTEEPLPSKQVYKSAKPYSSFDNRVRDADELVQGSWTLDAQSRKLTVTTPSAQYIALAYNKEIILAFNWEENRTTAEYYINFVAQAERQLVNQLATPAPFSFSSNQDTVQIAVTNVEPEPVTIEASLQSDVKTENVAANTGDPADIQNATASFSFTSLEPNTTYQVQFKAIAIEPSEKQDSATGFLNIKTTIIPTNVPIFAEKDVTIVGNPPSERYEANYNITNSNSFQVDVFVRVDGFEYQIGNIAANSTKELKVSLSDDTQFINRDIAYTVDFRFQTTQFTNNWFSDYTAQTTLLISQLETPTFVSSSATDVTTTWVWRNQSNRTVQIEMDLFVEASGINVFVEKKTGFVLAGLTSTQTFTGLQTQQTYKTTAKALQTGFRLESDLSPFSPTRTTLPPTTTQPSISIGTRTVNSIQFTFTNQDGAEVDIYWNLTGNPGPGDNDITDVAPGAPVTRTATQLDSGTPYTIFWRAQATGKLISSIGQSTTGTLRQLVKPTFGTASTTFNSINSQWANPNDVSVVMETRLQIGASPVPDTTKTTNIAANGDGSVLYEDLGSNATYNIVAKFLGDADNVESPTENSGLITTDVDPATITPDPSVTNLSTTSTSVTFTLVNNDNEQTGMGWGLSLPVSNFANVTNQSTTGFSNLDPDTPYILYVNAQTPGKTLSETIEVPFTTDPVPMGTTWAFISLTTPDETLNRGFVANSCPTTTSNQTWLTGEVPPSSRPVGYIIAVTSSSESGGFPIECTTHHFIAQ